ncbi:MAG: hypothetical protein JXR91_12715 [Deltaproteobacteria bacterium]|nr:hypothetical protein [Deltaproteobacteria bacterium]
MLIKKEKNCIFQTNEKKPGQLIKTSLIFTIFILSFLNISCTRSIQAEFAYNGSFFRTQWNNKGLFSSKPDLNENYSSMSKISIRDEMKNEAEKTLNQHNRVEDLGFKDIKENLKKLNIAQCKKWNSLYELVEFAKSKSAFYEKNHPKTGDLVFFHNQSDSNNNGKNDDWFTGAGVVISIKRGHITVVSRTMNYPKQMIITPDGPMVHTYQNTTINSFAKIPGRYDPKDSKYLSGQLYAGFIDIEKLAIACDKQK